MAQTYLTTDELSARIKYDSRTIRERLKDSVLLEGIHYIRPFGGRKILFIVITSYSIHYTKLYETNRKDPTGAFGRPSPTRWTFTRPRGCPPYTCCAKFAKGW